METERNAKKNRMNHLIIYCNPNPKSLSAAYRDALIQLTEMSGNPVNVRDLYNIGFHPVLEQIDFDALKHGQIPADVKVEQDYVLWADLITFVYPIWWSGMPALLKGYIDRVFTKGFAYRMDEKGNPEGLLGGRKVMILNNMGAAYADYEKNGMLKSLKQISDEGIFEFCGMKVVEHRFFGHLDAASKNEREGHVNVLKILYDKVLKAKS